MNHGMWMILLIIIGLGGISPVAHSEYRAYQLILERTLTNPRDFKLRWVTQSTMSPRHFIAYRGGPLNLKARALRTWICPGNTSSFKATCDSPYPLDDVPEELLQDQSISFEEIPEQLADALNRARSLAAENAPPPEVIAP